MYFNNKFVIIYIQQKIVKYRNKSKLKLQHVIFFFFIQDRILFQHNLSVYVCETPS